MVYGDRSGPRILEIDSVILKLSRFPQVKSEREWTLVGVLALALTHLYAYELLTDPTVWYA